MLFLSLSHTHMHTHSLSLSPYFLSLSHTPTGAAYRQEKDLLTILKHEWIAEKEEMKLLGEKNHSNFFRKNEFWS